MVGDSTAQCAAHLAPAIGACERCGTFVCGQCGFQEDGRVRCFNCGAPAAEKPPPTAFAALIFSALGLMCPPVSLLGLLLALISRFGREGSTRLGAQYSRWALVVGLMSLLAGGTLYAVLGRMVWSVQESLPR